MKKIKRAATRSRRAGFDQKLQSYSTLSAAALATTGVMAFGATATASAQIVTLSVSDLTGGSAVIPPLGATDNRLHHLTNGGYVRFAAPSVSFVFYGRQANSTNHPFVGDLGASGNILARLAYGQIAAVASNARNFIGGLGHNINSAPASQWGNSGGNVFATHSVRPSSMSRLLGGHRTGNFQPAGTGTPAAGYLGVRFGTAGNYRYGWLHIQVGEDANGRPTSIALTPGPNTGDVVGAYNDLVGGSIYAGQVSAIPEPASVATGLALFALGAVGVREHRRRRKLAA